MFNTGLHNYITFQTVLSDPTIQFCLPKRSSKEWHSLDSACSLSKARPAERASRHHNSALSLNNDLQRSTMSTILPPVSLTIKLWRIGLCLWRYNSPSTSSLQGGSILSHQPSNLLNRQSLESECSHAITRLVAQDTASKTRSNSYLLEIEPSNAKRLLRKTIFIVLAIHLYNKTF